MNKSKLTWNKNENKLKKIKFVLDITESKSV